MFKKKKAEVKGTVVGCKTITQKKKYFIFDIVYDFDIIYLC